MFYTLSEKDHQFSKSSPSKLLSIVPLCAKTVVLFCNDRRFYHYSLYTKEILFEKELPGLPFKAVAVSSDRIALSIIDSRTVILIDAKTKDIKQLCRMPSAKFFLQVKQKEQFFESSLHSFKISGNFFWRLPKIEERSLKVIYFSLQGPNGEYRQSPYVLRIRNEQDEKVDDIGSLVAYKQNIEQNGLFKLRLINLGKDCIQEQHILTSTVFTLFATVRAIRAISNNRFIIFVNNNPSTCLIFDKQQVTILCSQTKIILNTVMINIDRNYAVLQFFSPQFSCFDVLRLDNGKVIESRDFKSDEIIDSWDNDYFLNYARQKKESSVTRFKTVHLIDKATHYMKMMTQLKLDSQFKQQFCAGVLALLQ